MTTVTHQPRRLPGLTLLPTVHLPSVRGRAWADRGPLLLAAGVVLLATLLSAAIPARVQRTSDDAVESAVSRAGSAGAIVVTAPFPMDDDATESRVRQSNLAADLEQNVLLARFRLGRRLTAVLNPPVAVVTTPVLKVNAGGPGRTFHLSYLESGAGSDAPGPRVAWIAGRAPGSSVPASRADTAARIGDTPWPVRVGLSQQTAAQLKVGPGSRIPVTTSEGAVVDVTVSGIFRALDPADPAWQADPQLLHPVLAPDGPFTDVAMAGLLSRTSLPDARLAFSDDDIAGTISFVPDAQRMRLKDADALAAAVVSLKASSGSSTGEDTTLKWNSGLDGVLSTVRVQVAAASAQASVLLVGLVATAALVLLLAAELLVRRRAVTLAGARMRGAALVGIGTELVLESLTVTLAGAALGLLTAGALTSGISWIWPLPVILVAVLAAPVLGVRVAATATQGRQAPANRSARRSAGRTRQLRRLALETGVLLAAAGAFTALHQRGVLPAGPGDSGGNVLPALAPTLGAAVGALVLLRLLPPVARLAVHRAARSRRALPLLGAARAAATAAAPLPLLVLVLSSALLTFALSVSATERQGLADGAWRSVGGDARLDATPPSAQLNQLARQLSATPGVRHAVAARVTDDVPVSAGNTSTFARVVVVDTAAFRSLLAATPLPDAPQLTRLGTGRSAGAAGATGSAPVPVLLLSPSGDLKPGSTLSLRWNGAAVGLHAIGEAPAVGDGAVDEIMVDAATFATRRAGASTGPNGASTLPNTVWVTGPRAAQATRTVAAAHAGDTVTLRSAVLTERRTAPLAAGLQHLAEASAAVLLLLGLLGIALGAAAGAPGRGETLARLRTLGLRPADARRVAIGELLPPVIVGALGGLLVGAVLAHVTIGLLALRRLTVQSADPTLAVPLTTLVPVLLFALAVGVVVAVESSIHRRERLGQVLRAGGSAL